MKHVVILVMSDGDEIEVTRIFSDSMEAIAYAKMAANECAKGFFGDMLADWKSQQESEGREMHFVDEEPTLETGVEKFYVSDRGGDYQYSIKLEGMMHEWIVQGCELHS